MQFIRFPSSFSISNLLNPHPVQPTLRRGTTVLYRTGVTAIDKIAVPATPSLSGVTITGGSLVSGTSYNVTVAAIDSYGVTTVPTVAASSPGGSNNALNVVIAQVSGATKYALFLSTGANPLWVAEITEAQRASGGFQVTAVGVVSAGTAAAGSIDIGVVGTGLASNVSPFTVNTTWQFSGITPVDCTGYHNAIIEIAATVTDLRSLPSASIAWFGVGGGGKIYAISGQALVFFGTNVAALNILSPIAAVTTPASPLANGTSGLHVLVYQIAGQGTALDIYVTPVSNSG